ncbi:MAG: hypothetical protein WA691_04945 [Thermoplasmata archaeon]
MGLPNARTSGSGTPAAISPEDRHWLHDKYERLAAEEGQLSGSRTSYYAAIGTVLLTGLLIAIADLMGVPVILAIVVTLLATLGIMISVVWAVLLHRTNDAQALWREAALRIEQEIPPIPGEFRAPITLRSGDTVPLDLLRPFQAHEERFSTSNPISWMDRVNPERLTEILPLTFLGLWSASLVVVWVWFLFYR